jgi:hypothetical protein
LPAAIVSDAAHPVPVTAITVPTGPLTGSKTAVVVVTVKALGKVCVPLADPVIAMYLRPTANVGTVMVPDRLPAPLTVRVCVAVAPPTVTLPAAIVSDATHPVPVTVTVVPTGPLTGSKTAVAAVAIAGAAINRPKLRTSTRATATRHIELNIPFMVSTSSLLLK